MTTTPRTNRTHKGRRDWKPAFLKALAEHGTVTLAAAAADIARSTAYLERQRDEDFALAWADVEHTVTEQLEKKALDLALDGDTRMIEFLLKARKPTAYRESRFQIEHSGKVAHDLASKSDAELRQLAADLADRMGA